MTVKQLIKLLKIQHPDFIVTTNWNGEIKEVEQLAVFSSESMKNLFPENTSEGIIKKSENQINIYVILK